jgi:hypothetical protein
MTATNSPSARTLNETAQAFWRDVIGQYTAGAFVEHELRGGWWEGRVQCFESWPAA